MDKCCCCCINTSVKQQHLLQTERLVLRALMIKDAISLRDLANNPVICRSRVWFPVPGYWSKGFAKWWIRDAAERYAAGTGAEFGIRLKGREELLGVIGFADRSADHASTELGFVLDPRYWGKGYATEAAAMVVCYGFITLKLNRIYAEYRVSNPASARVLAKLGMQREGLMRQCAKKGKGFEDMVLMAVLREDWFKLSGMRDPKHRGVRRRRT